MRGSCSSSRTSARRRQFRHRQSAGDSGAHRPGMVSAAVLTRSCARSRQAGRRGGAVPRDRAAAVPAMARQLVGEIWKIPPVFPFLLLGSSWSAASGWGYLGSQEVTDSATLVARILAIGYFGYLLIALPLLGLLEKTKTDTRLDRGRRAGQVWRRQADRWASLGEVDHDPIQVLVRRSGGLGADVGARGGRGGAGRYRAAEARASELELLWRVRQVRSGPVAARLPGLQGSLRQLPSVERSIPRARRFRRSRL